jgi:hypothetical protein
VLFCVGGEDGNDCVSIAEVYDVCSNSWSPIANCPSEAQRGAAVFVHGALYVAGGYNGKDGHLKRFESFSPGKNTWTQLANLGTPRNDVGLASMNGHIFAIGVYGDSARRSVERYDVKARTWSPAPFLNVGRYSSACVTVAVRCIAWSNRSLRGGCICTSLRYNRGVMHVASKRCH